MSVHDETSDRHCPGPPHPALPNLPSEFPLTSVSDHEVLLSFNGDREGVLFREWWEESGKSEWVKFVDQQT